MNERIRELALQADLSKYNDLDDTYVAHINELKKFAELIVRECVGIALEQKKWVEDMEILLPQHVEFNRARIQQSQRIVDKIKEHFGVEE